MQGKVTYDRFKGFDRPDEATSIIQTRDTQNALQKGSVFDEGQRAELGGIHGVLHKEVQGSRTDQGLAFSGKRKGKIVPTDKDLKEHLQAKAEKIVHEQLSDTWRYRVFAISNRMPDSPDMIVDKWDGGRLYLCIQGVDTNANITSKEANWKESCLEFARQRGITPHFLEVVILDRKGKGHDIFIKGLMELGEELRSPKEKTGPTDKIVWVADPALNDLYQVIETNSEVKRKFYEEMEAADKLEDDRMLKAMLLAVKDKPIDKIPERPYCYTSDIPADKIAQWEESVRLYGEVSVESLMLYDEIKVITTCPYREWTDYGTVKCHFLEEEAVGLSNENYEKALKHFGSEEKMNEVCQGDFLLADAVQCCTRIVENIKQAK
jgi:hypothetical protein